MDLPLCIACTTAWQVAVAGRSLCNRGWMNSSDSAWSGLRGTRIGGAAPKPPEFNAWTAPGCSSRKPSPSRGSVSSRNAGRLLLGSHSCGALSFSRQEAAYAKTCVQTPCKTSVAAQILDKHECMKPDISIATNYRTFLLRFDRIGSITRRNYGVARPKCDADCYPRGALSAQPPSDRDVAAGEQRMGYPLHQHPCRADQ